MMATEYNNKPSVIAKLMSLDAPLPRQQQPVYRQQRVFSENYLQRVASVGSHEKRSRLRTIRQKPDSCNGGMQGLRSPIGDRQTGNIEDRKDLVLRPNLGSVKRESRPFFLLDFHSGWELKKQLLERSKRTKVSQEIWSSKRVWNLGGTPFVMDLESNQRLELGTRVMISNYDGWKDKSVTKLPTIKRFNRPSRGNAKLKNVTKGDLSLSSVGRHKNVSINSSTNFQAAEFSSSFDVSYGKELSCEEGFKLLNCIDVNDELTRNTGEAYQASPNSVLEPDNSSSSENGESACADLHGLWMKLQILKSESEENESSKSESVAISNEDGTERPVIRCFGRKESQQFFYLVNVLNEMGFHGDNVELDFERCMTNPVIFKTLEKKYEKEKSWSQADRRLLFDRINLGLTEVVSSKSLRRKMSNVLKRDVVEEELWNMLLSQEKEVNADLSKNSVWEEPWLQLRDEVDSIVVEIEAFLFNELATELVVV